MQTTTLFVELVVGGVQCLIWMGLLGSAVLGDAFRGPLGGLPSELALFLLPVAYWLGVVFDRVWDRALALSGLDGWAKRRAKQRAAASLGEGFMTSNPGYFDRARAAVFRGDDPTAAAYVDYARSRLRIARSSVFNSLLLAASGVVWLRSREFSMLGPESLFVAGAGLLMAGASLVAYIDLRLAYYKTLSQAGGEAVAGGAAP